MKADYRDEIQFLLNDRNIVLSDVEADKTLLDFLRLDQRLTGTKEGCAEGDCGACTILVGRLHDGELRYESVNACIRFLVSLDGCHIITVEHLSGSNGQLHPVQQAMVDFHGSQCGFCTPGIVMSLYALWLQTPEPTEIQIETSLQGNLCRCTGYEPIIKAAKAMSSFGSPVADYLTTERENISKRLKALNDGKRVVTGPDSNRAILPADVDDLAMILEEQPNSTIVAGSTDVGLWVTKFLRPIGPAVFIGHLDDLKSIVTTDGFLEMSAGVTYSECEDALTAIYPHLGPYWNRIAGWQVRNMGTVGGNIANGSPIGDTPPVLISLGAEIVLRKGNARRIIALQDYFIDYGKQDLTQGEFVEKIRIPHAISGQRDAAYKISKRKDEDISSVAVGISVTVIDEVMTNCKIAFGGMAATPKRSASAEAALEGQPWSEGAFAAAAEALANDFEPLSDWRASAEYRMLSAQNLLRRFYLEHDGSIPGPLRLNSA